MKPTNPISSLSFIRRALPCPAWLAIAVFCGASAAMGEEQKTTPGIPIFQKSWNAEWYAWSASKGRAEQWPDEIKVNDEGEVHVLDIPPSDKGVESSYFVTYDDYRNYRLSVEYKWGEKKFPQKSKSARNSGILYHMWGEDVLWPGCFQFQIKEGLTGDYHLLGPAKPKMDIAVKSGEKAPDGRPIFSKDGELLKGYADSVQASPQTERLTGWNQCVLEVVGAASRHFVNGTLTNEAQNLTYPDGRPLTGGKIGFQLEGSEILFRHAAIAPMSWPVDHAPFRVLVFSKTAGFRHDSIPAGVEAIRQLGRSFGFEVAATENADDFTTEKLHAHQVVVFLSTTGDVLNLEQQAAFEGYIRGGGGFVGVHAASDTEFDWPWFGELVGAYFSGHPAQQTADLYLMDENSVSTSTLPQKWTRKDEWYNFKQNPDGGKVQLLLRIDERSYKGGTMGESHPMSWQHEFDGGRSWYTALGHTQESFHEPLFLMHLLGGIQYAAGLPAAK